MAFFPVVVQLNHRTFLIAKILFLKENNNEWRIYSFTNDLFLTTITEPLWMLSIRQNHIPYISNILKRVLNVIFWVWDIFIWMYFVSQLTVQFAQHVSAE